METPDVREVVTGITAEVLGVDLRPLGELLDQDVPLVRRKVGRRLAARTRELHGFHQAGGRVGPYHAETPRQGPRFEDDRIADAPCHREGLLAPGDEHRARLGHPAGVEGRTGAVLVPAALDAPPVPSRQAQGGGHLRGLLDPGLVPADDAIQRPFGGHGPGQPHEAVDVGEVGHHGVAGRVRQFPRGGFGQHQVDAEVTADRLQKVLTVFGRGRTGQPVVMAKGPLSAKTCLAKFSPMRRCPSGLGWIASGRGNWSWSLSP